MREISAGGVVYREVDGDGRMEIQLIEDRFGKVTLAKGKMEPGETKEQTALREIMEETGISGEIIAPLLTIQYQYNKPGAGLVDKVVHYYLVRAQGGELRAQTEEIDGVSWHAPAEAWARQRADGYANNDEVLRLALQLLGIAPMAGCMDPDGGDPAEGGISG